MHFKDLAVASRKRAAASLGVFLLASMLAACGGGGDGGDGGSATSRSPSASADVTPAGGTATVGTVNPADIITRASADVPFSEQKGYTAQVINTHTQANEIPESGIHGSTLPNGETLRLGKTIDPMNPALRALAFQVSNSDPTTSGGKRAELRAEPNIEMNKVYWIVFSAYLEDWGALGDTDSALFGTQLHSGDDTLGLSPSFSLYTTQNGRMFQVQARYSESGSPSQSNQVTRKYAEYPIPFQRWTDFVARFKLNTSGNGFLQLWMDGEMIADYQGSLGFNTGKTDYAKFGYYNWSGSAMGSGPRKVLLRAPTIVADPSGTTYNIAQMKTLLGEAH
ncbi:MAG TPA: heparin lyase I family protein [Burkholderiales bacterium]|jgi:hypothetical protein